MKAIPAIDISEGLCVRLRKGDYEQKSVYDLTPLRQAKIFEEAGFSHLHLVDLDGAKTGESKHLHILEKIAAQTSLSVDFGGGIKSKAQVQSVFNAGAKQVNIGSWAVKNPEEVADCMAFFGAGKIILAADVQNGKIATNAWQSISNEDIKDFIQAWTKRGLVHFFCTDIEKDGMLSGVNLPLYADLKQAFPQLRIWASGGVSSLNDLILLQKTGVEGVIIGKAIYEGKIQLQELKDFA